MRHLSVILVVMLSTTALADGGVEWRHQARRGAVALMANPLRAAPRLAFYEARGFSPAAVKPYAESCGFSLGMRNDGSAAVSTRLADWHAMSADGRRIALWLPATWDARWEKAGVPAAARIAFRWAQFQAENDFEPGDWIMGMATLKERPKAPFRLVARYRDDKGTHEIALESLACAED